MFRCLESVRGALADQFGGGRVAVIGDLMLDVYLHGSAERISPEAPVPIVRISGRTEVLGGAGNVIRNLTGLGLRVITAGFVGDDEPGRRLRSLLAESGDDTEGVLTLGDRPTVTKTRVSCGGHQMIRLDREEAAPIDGADLARLEVAISRILGDGVAALILSDYAKGTLSGPICRTAIAEARRRGIPVLVDPKGRDFRKYAHATAITPNLREFEAIVEADPSALDGQGMDESATRLREDLGLKFLVVTRGDRGLSLFEPAGASDFPAMAREVFDVSGAGDTVIATLTASIVAGLGLDDALRLANVAAGIVVGKVGTTPIKLDDLRRAVDQNPLTEQTAKILGSEELALKVEAWRAAGERIVFTNGCFDLLHAGHVDLLARARSEGDRLVVAINTDRSIRELKGPSRPVVHEADRARVLAGLSCVDAVTMFDDQTPLRLIEATRPDVLVKGADYAGATIVGADYVESLGGRVVLVPLVEGRSTTSLVARASKT